MLRIHKYRIYPTEDQKVLLAKHFGCARFVYNWALDYKIKYYAKYKKNITAFGLTSSSGPFMPFKQQYEWLYEVNSQSLQASLGCLDDAYHNFFEGRAKFPKFKKRHGKQTAKFYQKSSVDFLANKLILLKFSEGIKCVFSRKFVGRVGIVTVSKEPSEKYYASIMVHTGEPEPTKLPATRSLGLDFGLKTFITTSNGDRIESPQFSKQAEAKLAKLQRQLARKVKGSRNREKAKVKVARCHERIAFQRKDFLHKLTTRLVHENQVDTFCIEDLNIEGMKQRWGFKVSDLSWSEFTRQLQHKCDRVGKNLIKIGRFEPSSQICSRCGYINKRLSLIDRVWLCPECGVNHDRDINAAINIRNFGMNKYQLGQELPEVTPAEMAKDQGRGCRRSRKDEGLLAILKLNRRFIEFAG